MAGSVGFVPTMGYLHDGHMSLVRRSLAENAHTIVSIFVNPAQFAPGEDFERYPRDEVRDLAMLREAGVDAVYLPSASDIYPEGYQTYVDVEQVTGGSKANLGRATSVASRRSSSSCSTLSSQTAPTSAAKTPSNGASSSAWPPTSTSLSKSSPVTLNANSTASL